VIIVADTSVGVLGVLLQAKPSGFLLAVRPVLDDLQRDAGFWIAEPVRRQVLALAGESD
jgi:predicted nucleic acid-binding protein